MSHDGGDAGPHSLPAEARTDAGALGTHVLVLPETSLSRAIDGLLRRIGEALSWIWLVLLAVIMLNVTMRYVFGSGRVEFEEAQWHLYAAGFLAGLSYCVQNDSHIRVDFLRERMSPRLQAWFELYGILLLVLPFVTLVMIYAMPFVAESFASGEVSPSPGGLPFRWLIKLALPAGFALLALAFVARLHRVCRFLFGDPSEVAERH
jgi:TRAP-type mannitol/chloroaromatic compound transport system permease small subunit